MTDQPIDPTRPEQDPAEGKPGLEPGGQTENPGEQSAAPSTGGDGAQGAGGPDGFGTGD